MKRVALVFLVVAATLGKASDDMMSDETVFVQVDTDAPPSPRMLFSRMLGGDQGRRKAEEKAEQERTADEIAAARQVAVNAKRDHMQLERRLASLKEERAAAEADLAGKEEQAAAEHRKLLELEVSEEEIQRLKDEVDSMKDRIRHARKISAENDQSAEIKEAKSELEKVRAKLAEENAHAKELRQKYDGELDAAEEVSEDDVEKVREELAAMAQRSAESRTELEKFKKDFTAASDVQEEALKKLRPEAELLEMEVGDLRQHLKEVGASSVALSLLQTLDDSKAESENKPLKWKDVMKSSPKYQSLWNAWYPLIRQAMESPYDRQQLEQRGMQSGFLSKKCSTCAVKADRNKIMAVKAKDENMKLKVLSSR